MTTTGKQSEKTAKWTVSTGGWPTENWVGLVVLIALGMLIAIRMGFRGINVPGVGSASLS
jgi:hypothetical protein